MGDEALSDKNTGRTHANIGNALLQLGRLPEARAAYCKRLELATSNRDSGTVHAAKGDIARLDSIIRDAEQGNSTPFHPEMMQTAAAAMTAVTLAAVSGAPRDPHPNAQEFERLRAEGVVCLKSPDVAGAEEVFGTLVRVGQAHDLPQWLAEGYRGQAAIAVTREQAAKNTKQGKSALSQMRRERCLLMEKWYAAAVRGKDRKEQGVALNQLALCDCPKHSAKSSIAFSQQLLDLSLQVTRTGSTTMKSIAIWSVLPTQIFGRRTTHLQSTTMPLLPH